ncbi:hypothetical protein BH11PSE8_BH11PSE8_24300 [soil metagenome]
MMVAGDVIQSSRGPKEHHTRPAIDPLFRSAALARGGSVVGVVLTGMMDDGTQGLQAIKACGGTAVVQSPADAFCAEMPLSALRHVAVDHCVALAELPALLTALTHLEQDTMPLPIPERLRHEQALAGGAGNPLKHLAPIATPSTFTCPDCHGSLWKVTDSTPERLICHIGHGYSLLTLMHAMTQKTDEAVWSALRALQEQGLLLQHSAMHEREQGNEEEAARLDSRSAGLQRQADLLRALLNGESAEAAAADPAP